MNSAPVFSVKRGRGRPRSSVTLKCSNFNHPSPTSMSKRKQLDVVNSTEVEEIKSNGIKISQVKKQKQEDPNNIQPTRLQPHRAARFTESYGNTASPDVVVISDEEQKKNGNDEEEDSDSDSSECSPMPSPVAKVRSKEEIEEWESTVQKYKKQLLDEEVKLILLRKLKESQTSKDIKKEPNVTPSHQTAQKSTPQQKTISTPVSVPNKAALLTKYLMPHKKDCIQNNTSKLNIVKQKLSLPNQTKVEANNMFQRNVTSSGLNLQKPQALQQFPLLKSLSNQITITPVGPTTSSAEVKPPEQRFDVESIAHRRDAAKLALRRQLEKTLLEIPLPKRPPLRINFVPNSNSIEFLWLLGLDAVVDYITKSKRPPPEHKQPTSCAQCATDFTCEWIWSETDRNGKKVGDYYCESCFDFNIRKALKAQHTQNLKTAFLKALQKEKEIDKMYSVMKKSHTSTPPPPRVHNATTFAVPKPHHIPKSSSSKPNPPYVPSAFQAQAHLLSTNVPLHPNVLPFSLPYNTPRHRGKASTGLQCHPERVKLPSIPHASSAWRG